ncbi:MAG: hypothetical protein GC150_16525 [Rhizobiales bacterium]|nr:hypothetical protein [Hyphomicrobiales bacterium]
MERDNHDPAQWNQAVGYARLMCARIFRDGGSPADALAAFGVRGRQKARTDWSAAVDDIAAALCRPARAA